MHVINLYSVRLIVGSLFLCFVSTRGEGAKGEAAFRESFARLGELRSLAKEGEVLKMVIGGQSSEAL